MKKEAKSFEGWKRELAKVVDTTKAELRTEQENHLLTDNGTGKGEEVDF